MEFWKDVVGFDNYEVSSDGQVRNKESGKILVCGKRRYFKYKKIELWNGGKRQRVFVHRVVADTFIPNPDDKPQVNHKDGNKMNNSIPNLEWVTNRENMNHYLEILRPARAKSVINHI